MVKLINIRCDAFDANQWKEWFHLRKCTCTPACSLNMDLPIVFHPVSRIMQNTFNYMHFKIYKTIKQKKEKERKK